MDLDARLSTAEATEKKLIAEIEDLEKATKSTSELLVENEKLKYQKETLLKNIWAPRISANNSFDIFEYSKGLFRFAIESGFPDQKDLPIAVSSCPNSTVADFQCNSALQIFAKIKGSPNAPSNPKACAQVIVDNLPKVSVIKEINISGPGFVQILYRNEFLTKLMDCIYVNGVLPPATEKKRICIDFSSPNIAKQMHVGHLRSTIIGDTLARVLEFVGHDVLRINHVGDWGTQFGMLICHLQDKYPNFETESPPIGDLQKFYQESKIRYDEEEEFNVRAHKGVVKLQQGDPATRTAWKLICDESRKEFQKTYDLLDIKIKETGESFYQPLMPGIVSLFEEKGLVTVEDARKLVYCIEGKPPLTIEKSDGGYTYDTSDLAALNYRLTELKADWCVYVVDVGQALHFELVFDAAKKAGLYDPTKNRVEHVGFGVVLDDNKKKFKTRSGQTVKLSELLERSVEHAKLAGKEREDGEGNNLDDSTYETIAYAAVKYADLKNKRTLDYIFSFERMMSLKGDTAARMLYSYARIAGISRKAGVDPSVTRPPLEAMNHPSERALMFQALNFPNVINQIVKDLAPHPLCEYLYHLTNLFNAFYRDCRCLDKDKEGNVIHVHMSRLTLCDTLANIFKISFNLLGIKPIEKM